MTYNVIKPRPDPTELALDDEADRRAAISDFEDARQAIADAVRGHTETVEDTDDYYRLRAVVPFRVTAYKHDFDDDRVEELWEKYGRDPAYKPTDGFVDVSGRASEFYRSIPFHHDHAISKEYSIPQRRMAKKQAQQAIEGSVIESVEDGKVTYPITKTVHERVEESEPEPVGMESKDAGLRDETFETKERSFRIGTATYKVDGIVPPGEWDE